MELYICSANVAPRNQLQIQLGIKAYLHFCSHKFVRSKRYATLGAIIKFVLEPCYNFFALLLQDY